MLATYNTVDTIPFSQFERLVAEGNVTEVSVGYDTIQGKVKDKLPSGNSVFVTARVDAALAERLVANGVVVTGVPSGGLLQTILLWVLPALMFYLVWYFMGVAWEVDKAWAGSCRSASRARRSMSKRTSRSHLPT